MTVKYFNVKNGLSAGNITLDANSGNTTTTNLAVTGKTNLNDIANVTITGGSTGYVISTDGSGNLSFIDPSAGAQSPAPMPIVVDAGNTLTIAANYQGLFGYPLTINGDLVVDGVLIDVNDNGNGGGGGGVATALNADIANVIITGGSSGQYLQTDGTGNLSWAAGGGGGSGSPGGVNTQVQFNDAGSFGGNIGFTFNKTTGTLVASFFSGAGNALSNIQGANVSGAVNLATHATTANSVAVANVSGIGNISTINLDGNSSNILYGNGTFAAAPAGGGYGNSNVATFLAAYGSNTITTTGNVRVGNIIGNGQALTGINGANVTGAVAYATTANAVSGANVTGAVSYATVANSVAGANVTGEVGFAAVANFVAGANVNGEVTYAVTANSVAGANVTGEVAFAAVANSVAGANVSGQVSNALVSGTVYANAQPNITSTGTLVSLSVSGNANVGNIAGNTFTGNFSGNVSAVDLTVSNVANFTALSQLKIAGGSSGQYLQTDGTGNLSWAAGGGGGGVATALNADIANVIITGGSSGQYLQTDGTGNLSWAAGGGGGGGASNARVMGYSLVFGL